MKILIVEDNPSISNLIRMNLSRAGYECECVYDGMQAADLIEANRYGLILLDIMLPGVDGYELMEYIRPMEIPVIFLTAKSFVADKVKGLKLGADDYLTKPFEIVELLARVESVLRRYGKSSETYEILGITIDTASRSVYRGETQIFLTLKEYRLLILLVQNKNIALFRDKIYEQVWETEFEGDSRTVDQHIQRLRRKLNWEAKIVSVHKVGYRLEV